MYFVKLVSNWQIERFIEKVMEEYGYLPESIPDLEMGYFMSQASMKCTQANKMILDLILQNPMAFFTAEYQEEDKAV